MLKVYVPSPLPPESLSFAEWRTFTSEPGVGSVGRSSLKWERVGSEQHRSFLGKVDEPSTYTSTTLCIYLYANEKRATPFSAPEELLPKAIQERASPFAPTTLLNYQSRARPFSFHDLAVGTAIWR